MFRLLVLIVGAAAVFAYARRRAISRRAAIRILVVSAVTFALSTTGLFLLLERGVSLMHPYLWIWVLGGILLLSLCAIPFGIIPILVPSRAGGTDEDVF